MWVSLSQGMVFSAVIIRVSTDKAHINHTSNAASGSQFGFTKPGTRRTFAAAGNVASVNGTMARAEGVQITLDTVTHRDDSEFEMDKMESGSSPYTHKGEALA